MVNWELPIANLESSFVSVPAGTASNTVLSSVNSLMN